MFSCCDIIKLLNFYFQAFLTQKGGSHKYHHVNCRAIIFSKKCLMHFCAPTIDISIPHLQHRTNISDMYSAETLKLSSFFFSEFHCKNEGKNIFKPNKI